MNFDKSLFKYRCYFQPYIPFTNPIVDPPGDITTKQRRYDRADAEGIVGDYYFKAGFVETILSHQLKRNVTCTLKFAYRDEVHETYV